MVDMVGLQDYLYGVVGTALPLGSLSDAFKAQAIASRTIALWFKDHHAANLEQTDICDSDLCQKYIGVTGEMDKATQAVIQTAGLALSQNGAIAHAVEHENCGGMTEDGGQSADASLGYLASTADTLHSPGAFATPEDLERWVHDAPPQDVFCQASGLTSPAETRWVRVLDAGALKKRADAFHYVGKLTHIEILKRTATGRVVDMRVVGSRGDFTLSGSRAIGDFLSPGSLRSTLFTITPVMKGKTARYFILWGAGTGDGFGLCRAGLLGRAAAGEDYRSILAAYFPKLTLKNFLPGAEAKARKKKNSEPAQAKSGPKRSKNPHWTGAQ
jgi:stage II sporulation protein D